MEGRPWVTVIQFHSPFLIDPCDFSDALLFLYRRVTAQTDAGRHSVLRTLSSVSNRARDADDRGSFQRARAAAPPTYFDLFHLAAGGHDIIRTSRLPSTLFFSAVCLSLPLPHPLYPSSLVCSLPCPPVQETLPRAPALLRHPGRVKNRRPLCLGIIIT